MDDKDEPISFSVLPILFDEAGKPNAVKDRDFLCLNCQFKQHQCLMLKEIVDKLQWYVQNGDTIVDFCCGDNDFSQFMKETLVAAGKKCSFKNYDIFPPKYNFNFERRDWLKVQQNELPTGSQLIIGLNPPFGIKSALANKYIDKALSFKPKLVILLVPQDTERLDEKNPPYDLIWEDGGSLSGKRFNLKPAGSVVVDANEKQMEHWNEKDKAPPLYLWSRLDWTTKHKAIASKQGHTFKEESRGEDEWSWKANIGRCCSSGRGN